MHDIDPIELANSATKSEVTGIFVMQDGREGECVPSAVTERSTSYQMDLKFGKFCVTRRISAKQTYTMRIL